MALIQTELSELFVALFNRGSEASGLTWVNGTYPNDTRAQIADTLLATPDAVTYYGGELTDLAFVQMLFKNILDRDYIGQDNIDGMDFYAAQLSGTGAKTRGELTVEIIDTINRWNPETGDLYDPNNIEGNLSYQQFANRVALSNYTAETVAEPDMDTYAVSTSFKTDANPTGGLEVNSTAESLEAAQAGIVVYKTTTEKTVADAALAADDGSDAEATAALEAAATAAATALTAAATTAATAEAAAEVAYETAMTAAHAAAVTAYNAYVATAATSKAAADTAALDVSTTELANASLTAATTAATDAAAVVSAAGVVTATAAKTTTTDDDATAATNDTAAATAKTAADALITTATAAVAAAAANVAAEFTSDTTVTAQDEDIAIGTEIKTVTTNEEGVTYTLDNANFAISAEGVITTAAALDYETMASEVITVTATDTDGNETTQELTLDVNDLTATYAFAADAATAIDGDTVNFTFTVTNAAESDVTEVTYTISGVNAADVVGAQLTGTATVTDGVATVAVTLLATAANAGKTVTATINDGTTDYTASTTIEEAAAATQETISLTDIAIAADANNGAGSYITKTPTVDTDYTINSQSGIADAKVVIGGDSNLTITSKTGSDTLVVDGTGNNVVDAGAGQDTVYLSTGNNVVIVEDGDFDAVDKNSDADTTDSGEFNSIVGDADGVNTIVTSGTNDFTTGTLTNINNLVLEAGAKSTFSELQAAGFNSIVANGTTAELTISKDTDDDLDTAGNQDTLNIDLTNVLTGTLKKLTLGANTEITLTAEQIENITTFNVDAAANIVTTAAGALLLAEKGVTPEIDAGAAITLEAATTGNINDDDYVSYEINATAEEIFDNVYVDGIADQQIVDNTGTTTATINITDTANVAQASTFKVNADTIGSAYAVSDTSAKIAASATTTYTYEVTTVANEDGDLVIGDYTYTLVGGDATVDTLGTNLVNDFATTPTAKISDITYDAGTDTFTITAFDTAGTVTVTTDDTTLVGTSTTTQASWLNSTDISSLTITSAATVAETLKIFATDGALATAVTESADDDTDDLTITTPTFTISDSATNIATAANTTAQKAIIDNASSISVLSTTSTTVLNAGYIVDNLSNLLDGGFNLSDNATAIYGANSEIRDLTVNITVTGNSTVAQANRIDGYNNTGTTTFNIQDTGLALANATTTILDAATAVTIKTDTDSNKTLDVAQATKLIPYLANTSDIIIEDTAENLTSTDGLAAIANFTAATVSVEDAATLAQATTLVAEVTAPAQTLALNGIEDAADTILATLTETETDTLANNEVDTAATTAAKAAIAVVQAGHEAVADAQAVGDSSTYDAAAAATALAATSYEVGSPAYEAYAAAAALIVTAVANFDATGDAADTDAEGEAAAALVLADLPKVTATGDLTAANAKIIYDLDVDVVSISDTAENVYANIADNSLLNAASVTVTNAVASVTGGDTAEDKSEAIYAASATRETAGEEAIEYSIELTNAELATMIDLAGTTPETLDANDTGNKTLLAAESITIVDTVGATFAQAAEIALLNTALEALTPAKTAIDYAMEAAVGTFHSDETDATGLAQIALLQGATTATMTGEAADIKAYAIDTATDGIYSSVDNFAITIAAADLATDMTGRGDYYDDATSITITDSALNLYDAEAVYTVINDDSNAAKLAFTNITDTVDRLSVAKDDITSNATVGKATEVTVTNDIAEVVTLDLHDSFAAVGADTFAFDGTTVTFTDGDVEADAAADIIAASYTNWIATAGSADDIVVFTKKVAGADANVYNVTDEMVFTDVAGASTSVTGVATHTTEGADTGRNITVEEAKDIASAVSGDLSIETGLVDTVANLLTSASVLPSLTSNSVTATDTATAAEYQTLIDMLQTAEILKTDLYGATATTADDEADINAKLNVEIVDTIENVQNMSVEALSTLGDDSAGVSNTVTLEAGTQVALSVAQAEVLAESSGLVDIQYSTSSKATYELIDTVENLVNAMIMSTNTPVIAGSVLAPATKIIATGGIDITTADEYIRDNATPVGTYLDALNDIVGDAAFDEVNSDYTITADAATLVGGTVDDAITSATTITVADVAAVKEVFTLELHASLDVDVSGTIEFDGTTVTLADGDIDNDVAAKLVAASYDNWTATNVAGTSVVTFTAKEAGDVATVVGDFTFTDGGTSTSFEAAAGGHTVTTVGADAIEGITLENADTLVDLNSAVTFTSINDTFAELITTTTHADTGVKTYTAAEKVADDSLKADLIAKAGNNVTINDAVTVAELNAAVTALNGSTVTFANLTDTAANIAAAGTSLASVTAMTVDNTLDANFTGAATDLTVAQADAIAAETSVDVTYNLVDTNANLAAASQASFNGATAISVSDTVNATATQALAIENTMFITNDTNDTTLKVDVTIEDTAANVVAVYDDLYDTDTSAFDVNDVVADTTTDAGEDAIILTTTVTVAQSDILDADCPVFTLDSVEAAYTGATVTATAKTNGCIIEDTYANVMAALDAGKIAGAQYVVLTDEINISKATQLDDAGITTANTDFSITETIAYFAASYSSDDDTSIDNDILGGANSITIVNSMTDSTVVGTFTMTEAADNRWFITADVETLAALPEELLAAGYVIKDTAANFATDSGIELQASDNSQGYIVADTSANILLAGASVAGSAALAVEVSDTVDAATLELLQELGNTALTVAGVSDTATALDTANLEDTVQNIDAITVTDATVTIAQMEALEGGADGVMVNSYDGDHDSVANDNVNTTATYTISDESANIDFTGTYASNNIDTYVENEVLSAFDNADLLENAQSVTIDGDLTVNEAGLAYNFNSATTMTITDSTAEFANLFLAAGTNTVLAQDNQIAAINAATTVSLSSSQTVTVAQAVALTAVAGFDGVYTLLDGADELAAADASILSGAVEVRIDSDTATVAEATILAALTNIEKDDDAEAMDAINIEDTAANITAADVALLSQVKDIAISSGATDDDVTAAQATTLEALIDNEDVVGLTQADSNDQYEIVDTQANIANAANAEGVDGATAIVVTDAVTVAQAEAIYADNTAITVDITDTSAHLLAAAVTVGKEDSIVVTDDISHSLAASLVGYYTSSTVADFTFANIDGTYTELSSSSYDIVDQATTVTLSTDETLSVAELIPANGDGFLNQVGDKLVGGYDISDSTDAIVNAASNNEFTSAAVAGATHISVTGTGAMNVAASTVIMGYNNFEGDYSIEDTATAVSAITDDTLVNNATQVTVEMEAAVKETLDLSNYTTAIVIDETNNGAVTLDTANTKAVLTYVDTITGASSDTTTIVVADTIDGIDAATAFAIADDAFTNLIATEYAILRGNATGLGFDESGTGASSMIVYNDAGSVSGLVVQGVTDMSDYTIIAGTGTSAADDITVLQGLASTINGGADVDTITLASSVDTIVVASGDSAYAADASTSDVVVGFATGIDKLSLGGDAATAVNYAEDATSNANATDAVTDAVALLDTTVMYAVAIDDTNNNTYVAIDRDLDGTAEDVIEFTGLIDIAFGDIIA